jgi:hypothetical protein
MVPARAPAPLPLQATLAQTLCVRFVVPFCIVLRHRADMVIILSKVTKCQHTMGVT